MALIKKPWLMAMIPVMGMFFCSNPWCRSTAWIEVPPASNADVMVCSAQAARAGTNPTPTATPKLLVGEAPPSKAPEVMTTPTQNRMPTAISIGIRPSTRHPPLTRLSTSTATPLAAPYIVCAPILLYTGCPMKMHPGNGLPRSGHSTFRAPETSSEDSTGNVSPAASAASMLTKLPTRLKMAIGRMTEMWLQPAVENRAPNTALVGRGGKTWKLYCSGFSGQYPSPSQRDSHARAMPDSTDASTPGTPHGSLTPEPKEIRMIISGIRASDGLANTWNANCMAMKVSEMPPIEDSIAALGMNALTQVMRKAPTTSITPVKKQLNSPACHAWLTSLVCL
mmetsp:Transcript_41963/g.82408  ORF Transcript_41963/g.82408 Transcript_41963/m.82408 type:complete len:338 (-) Transcript_41963:463-1476(-)